MNPASAPPLAAVPVRARRGPTAALAAPVLLLSLLTLPGIAAAQEAAPVPDKGDTTWMLVSTAIVLMMSLPGLALFYGGLVRAKNMLSVLMQVLTGFSIMALLWVVCGYSLAFTGPSEPTAASPFIGGLSKAFLAGVTPESVAETFSRGVVIPEMAFVVFQLTFAGITPALIVGGVAERMKFPAVMLFLVGWFFLSYLPMAHMVWWWGGPSAHDAAAGFIFGRGALDFAGGTVVHINAGVAALVAALMVGPRIGHGREQMMPHNLSFTLVGGGLLLVGWLGFNAGSNLEANGLAAQAVLNTILAASAGALGWAGSEWALRGHPSLLGGVSGVVAGLVAVTPAAGFVGPMGAIALGAIAGPVCLWAVVWLKARLGYDDSLDVFGLHGVGGIVGALLTGVFAAPALGGSGVWDYAAGAVAPFDMGAQIVSQATGVAVCILWSAVASWLVLAVLRATIGLRVPQGDEREGLDLTTHGERAYS